MGVPAYYSEISRMLVELNRSEASRSLFSVFTKDQPEEVRQEILNDYYYPFRKMVFNHISRTVQHGEFILYIYAHSFAIEMKGAIRNADICLLHNPSRKSEKDIAARMAASLHRDSQHL